MSCRTTPAGSAWTTFARLESGLSDVQTLSTFHTLRRDGRGVSAPTDAEWAEFVAAERTELQGRDFSEARMRSLNTRMDRAAEQAPDGPTWYALRNIRDRSRVESEGLEANLRVFADRLGEDYDTVTTRFNTYLSEVERGRSVAVPEGYTDARAVFRQQNIPSDHGTYEAYTRLAAESVAAMNIRHVAEDSPRRITQTVFANSRAIYSAGYDPAGGRLEVTFRRHMGVDPTTVGTSRTYAYRNVPAHIWEEMVAEGGSPGAVYAGQVRSRSEYQYESREQEDADAHRRCPSCGQWAGTDHVCPEPSGDTPASTAVPVGRDRTRAEHLAVGAEINRILEESPAETAAETGDRILSSGFMPNPAQVRRWFATANDFESLQTIGHRVLAADHPRALQGTDRAATLELLAERHRELQVAEGFRCADCGQWAGPGHTCPTPVAVMAPVSNAALAARLAAARGQRVESPEAVLDDIENLRERIAEEKAATAQAFADADTDDDEDEDTEEVAVAAEAAPVVPEGPARPEPVTLRSLWISTRGRYVNTSNRRYNDAGYYDYVSLPRPIATVRSAAQTQPVIIPVGFSGTRSLSDTNPDGLPMGRFSVTGTLTFDRPARGQYEVDGSNLQCNCPAYQEDYRCPHTEQALNQYRAALIPARTGAGAAATVDPAAAQRLAEAALRQDWTRNEEHAAEARVRFAAATTPEDSYTDNFEAFEDDHNAALARKAAGEQAIPLMGAGAMGGAFTRESGRGFGVEMEFDFPAGVDKYTALRAIGQELYDAGLTPVNTQQGYHASQRRGYTDNHERGWSFEQDCTVDGEIVSPVMYDEPATWDNIAKICEVVKRHGGVANAKTGSHVHVGAANMTTQTASELVRMTNQHEDILYRVSQNPDRPKHRPMRWCGPNADVPQGGYRDAWAVRSVGSSHGFGVNLNGVQGEQSDHPEIRYWDGTLDPAAIQAQIKISAGLVQAAERNGALGASRRNREEVGSHKKRLAVVVGRSRRALTSEELSEDTTTYRSFVDTLFTRREDKAQAAALFAVTKWQARS